MNNTHELYKDFLEYAVEQGMDLERMQYLYILNDDHQGIHGEAANAVHEFEGMMYDFLGVQSVDDDPRLYALLECPSIYEIDHPSNVRG